MPETTPRSKNSTLKVSSSSAGTRAYYDSRGAEPATAPAPARRARVF